MTASSQGARATRLSAEARREQILDAAKRVIGGGGMAAASIESVARAAGITRPIVYTHFGDLAGLLEALIERETDRAVVQLAEVLPSDIEPRGARRSLLTALEAYLDAAIGDPDRWALLLIPPAGAPPLLRRRVEQGRAAVIAELAESVGGGIGGWAAADPELLARTLSAVSDEAVRSLLTDPERFSKQRILRFADSVLSALDGAADGKPGN